PYCKEDGHVKNTICTFLEMWLDMYPEDFCQSSDLSIVNQLMAYLLLNMPCSDLAVRVYRLLTQLKDNEASELESKGEEVSVLEGHTSAGHMPEAHLLVTVKPDTLEPEAACTPDARRGSSPTSPPAVCCKSANIPHFLHTLSLLLQWVYLLRKWPRQTQSIYSADSASSVVSLRLDF
ncbi:Ral guanine nucleotide dissociation stimulator, partial [Cricetulus griseus]